MDPTPAELNFSLPELEESGLLHCDPSAAASTDPQHTWPVAQLQQHDGAKAPGAESSTGSPVAIGVQATAGASNSSAQHPKAHGLQPVQERRYNSREYQRKFRERQKAKAQATQNMLAKTTTELEQLKLQQQELQIKLEQAEATIQATTKVQADAQRDPFAERPLVITLPGQEQEISFQEAQSMPSHQFVSLWQDYQKELQGLLASAPEEEQCAVDSRLCQLTLEALRFRGFSLSFTFSGNSTKAVAVPPPLPPDLHKQVQHIVEVLNLSKEQVHDLMFLRRVYHLRRHELEAKRAPDIKKAQQLDGQAMYGVMRMIGAAMRLQDNTIEDIRFRIRFGWAMYHGVFSIRQAAQMLVNVDARFEYKEAIWNYLAEQHGYPTQQQLLAFAPFGITHTEWDRAWEYTERVSPCAPVRTYYVSIASTAAANSAQ